MNNLILPSASGVTMTSIDLRDVINTARSEFGEAKVRNDQLVSRIEDELEGELGVCKIIAHPQSGVEMRYYDLTKDQCMLVGMRESKYVRRKVLEILNKPTTPQTFAEALQLAADQAKQLEIAAPKVNYYDKVVERETLLNATQVGQKIGLSAVILNRHLDELGVYNKAVKRGRAFRQSFVDAGHGIMRQTETGHAQPMFTLLGEAWVIEKLTSEGIV